MAVTIPYLKKIELSSQNFLERSLPSPGEIRVKVGDIVRPFDIVADTLINLREQTINIKTLFKTGKDPVDKFLLKREGEGFKRGDVIAEKSGFFGYSSKHLIAPFDGVLYHVDRECGEIILRTNPEKKTLLAGAGGEVVRILENRSVLLNIAAVQVRGVWSGGKTTEGEIIILSSFDQPLDLSKITPEVRGKIIVGGSFISAESLKKAMALGAIGVISGGANVLPANLFTDSTFCLLITEGFGAVPMLESTWRYLKSAQSRTAILIPERKVLLVPENSQVCATNQIREDQFFGPLSIGDRVQVFCWPYFGRVGEVIAIDRRKVFPSGVAGEVVKVRLPEEKEDVSVPLRNVGKLV